MCAQTVRTCTESGQHVTSTNPNRRTRLIAGATAGALAVAGAVRHRLAGRRRPVLRQPEQQHVEQAPGVRHRRRGARST